jgi:hypothetical protein
MIEIAGGIILGVVGLTVLGTLMVLALDWRTTPAPPVTVIPWRTFRLRDWAIVLFWPSLFAALIGYRLIGWGLGW